MKEREISKKQYDKLLRAMHSFPVSKSIHNKIMSYCKRKFY